ncbi:Permease of the drug/metabolite transporter (DMT) superfamily [Lachnospiraceae bacterium C7]|nr:Permease of the drug/metabolite transporter (DMT) superfamily [Lachnospiraceae bacterium C7]
MSQKKQGIVLIIMAGFFFSLMTLCVRAAGDLPTMEKAFFRNAVATLVAAFTLARSKEGFKIKKSSWKDLFFRCLCGTTGLICNFYAIDKINLADANILNKLSPFFAIIFSYFLLKEKANKVEWGCVILAFIGAIFVIKPSGDVQALYALIGALGGLGAGMAYTFVRKLGANGERGPIIVLCFSLFSCIVILPFLIANYEPMSLKQFLILMGAGVAASGGQFTITAAYTKAPAKEISVYDYTQILFAAMWGFMFYGEIPEVYSIIGYIIIIGSAIFKWYYVLEKSEEKNEKNS